MSTLNQLTGPMVLAARPRALPTPEDAPVRVLLERRKIRAEQDSESEDLGIRARHGRRREIKREE